MPNTPRTRLAVALTCATVLTTAKGLHATEPAPLVVTMGGSGHLRVQVSEGLTAPCDSSSNRMLFDGRLGPGETFRASIGGDCVCIRHMSASFPGVDWTTSGFVCRPRICHGRVCRPAPDPTIRIALP